MMLKNLVCSAFLAAALADSTAPSPTFMSAITTAASSTTTTDPDEESYPEGFDHRKPVHVVVDLGSSKSKIFAVESASGRINLENKKAWYPVRKFSNNKKKNKISTPVTISGKQAKKGVAGACRTDRTEDEPAWSTVEKCEEHLTAIADTLKKAADELNIISVRFLGTAGLRQSPQGVETLQSLEKKIGITFQGKDMEFEYRTLSGAEEAENEFLALKSAKDVVAGPDQTGDNELLGNIGLGGASVQFAVEEKADDAASTTEPKVEDEDDESSESDQRSGKKNLSVESVPHGLDAAWDQLGSDGTGGPCKIEDSPSTNIYEKCKAHVNDTFTSLFQQNNPAHWAQDHLKVYATGGIYYSIKGHFGETSLDHTREDLVQAAKDKCIAYEAKGPDSPEPDSPYKKFQCFRLTYIVHVIKSLRIDASKTIHFRDEIGEAGDKKKVQWVRAAAMKQNTPGHELLQAYVDTTSRTAAAVEAYKKRVDEYNKLVEAAKAATQVPAAEQLE